MNTYTTPVNFRHFTNRVPKHSGVFFELLSAVKKRLDSYMKRRREYRQNKINRLAFRTILNLDDHMLNDIGLTRHDVLWADQLPMTQSAAKELNKISKARQRTVS